MVIRTELLIKEVFILFIRIVCCTVDDSGRVELSQLKTRWISFED